MMTVRTRFAPSPTGYLHIGGARTALFNYLFARHNRGQFVLRIEDTDAARSTGESLNAILEGMLWLDLKWDEGPYYQSKRLGLYREAAAQLLEKNLAYRCWCAPEELEERRKLALKENRPPRYDGRCRTRPAQPAQPFAVRFRVPPGKTFFNDMIKGGISFEHAELEDLVLLRSDSTPTYNLCVVVDDAAMRITHVIRGDDHIANTPKQILLYEALGGTVPSFAHLPMILGSDKTRLSKRHGATSVMAYKEMGYLPHALVNYLARLGWSSGDEEIFGMNELIEKFSLENVGKSSGVFNPEKLLWLNHHYIKTTPAGELKPLLLQHLKTLGVDAARDERCEAIISTLRERAKTLKEMAEASLFYFREKISYEEKAAKKFLTHEILEPLKLLSKKLKKVEPFSEDNVKKAFDEVLEETGLKLGELAQPVRVALTGGTVSPGIFEMIAALGKEKTIERIEESLTPAAAWSSPRPGKEE
ncbi:MAG: glutamate--tRNA ligase [Deltaproteobacteria bacterium]|nr:glutamate--tRNA ligase [Deltaproteobacteria bacterium]